MTQCTARAFIFSGRPDPTWVVGEQQALRLEAIWKQLAPSDAPAPPRPVLGYRGISMMCETNEEYIAVSGYVRRKAGSAVEWKKDDERFFERLLLSTAPEGLIPEGIIDL